MESLSTWRTILDAIRDPFSLAGLIVLVTMIVLKLSLSKVSVLKGSAAYRTVRYSITVAGVLALIVTVGTILLRFYELRTANNRQSLQLTRVEAETLLQSNRGNIERCLSRLPQKYFYVDFVFTDGEDHAVNVDVIPGQKASQEIEFLHPALRKKEVEDIGGHDALQLLSRANKLSVTAPDVNGCIIGTLKEGIRRYSLQDGNAGFVHRYITDEVGR